MVRTVTRITLDLNQARARPGSKSGNTPCGASCRLPAIGSATRLGSPWNQAFESGLGQARVARARFVVGPVMARLPATSGPWDTPPTGNELPDDEPARHPEMTFLEPCPLFDVLHVRCPCTHFLYRFGVWFASRSSILPTTQPNIAAFHDRGSRRVEKLSLIHI